MHRITVTQAVPLLISGDLNADVALAEHVGFGRSISDGGEVIYNGKY